MTLEPDELKVKLSGHWVNVINALAPGLSEAVSKGKAHQPCPQCGGKDRFNFDGDFPLNGKAHCNKKCNLNSGDGLALLQSWNNWTFPEALEKLSAFLGLEAIPPKFEKKKFTLEDKVKVDFVNQVLKECEGITFKVGDYLQSRGLSDAVPDCIEYHPHLYHKLKSGDVIYEPCMVAKIIGLDKKPIGLQRIYLDREGPGKSPNMPNKMILGTGLQGASVHIGEPHDDFLFIAEGIETALAVHYMTSCGPVWASVSSTLMQTMDIPDNIKKVSIFADNDPAGLAGGAEVLARKLMKQGVSVKIRPSQPGKDWLDLFIEHGMATCSNPDNVPAYEVEPEVQSLPMLENCATDEIKQENFIVNRFFGDYENEDIENQPYKIEMQRKRLRLQGL